jgi:F0F1-type ATP synthase membrane subunit b/b'
MESSSNTSTLKPIDEILKSFSFSSAPPSQKSIPVSSNTFSGTSSSTSTFAFKIIILLIVLLVGIVGYTYLEKEINQLVKNIQNYLETAKYTKQEKDKEKEREKEEKEKENEENEKHPSTEDIIHDSQKQINKNKNNKNKNDENNKNNSIKNYQPSSKLNSSEVEEDVEEYSKDTLQKVLNDAAENINDVAPDMTESSIQSGKNGWCFIGADKLNRTCAEIGVNDICMSGDIYPTKDVCINPRLRA